MSTKDLKEKGTHFLLLTAAHYSWLSVLIFSNLPITLHLAESPVWQSLLLKPV